jgi:hypothetical protein
MYRDEHDVTHIECLTVAFEDGEPCPVCGRPRVFLKVGNSWKCGTDGDDGRIMDQDEPCELCRDAYAYHVCECDRDEETAGR